MKSKNYLTAADTEDAKNAQSFKLLSALPPRAKHIIGHVFSVSEAVRSVALS